MKVCMVRASEKALPEKPGIYKITPRYGREVYIGSTYNFRDRFGKHLSKLIREKHPNHALQKLFKRQQVLFFSVVKTCCLFELPRLEREHIARYGERALNRIKNVGYYHR